MNDIKDILKRIKRMTYYDVVLEVYEPIEFHGTIPFDLEISGNMITAQILAESYDEAEMKLIDFLFKEPRDD